MQEVIHVITTASRGGAENHLLLLAAEQVLRGKSVSVIFLKGDGNLVSKFIGAGVKVNEEIANKNPILQIFLLRRIFRQQSNAIVHAHLPRAELVASFAGPRMRRTFSRHNTEQFYPGVPKIISKAFGLVASYGVLQCIGISHAVKRAIISNSEIWHKTDIKVIHYGVANFDSGQKQNLSESIINKIKDLRGQGAIILTCVARLVPQKDFPTLLRGLKLTLEKDQNYYLFVAGDGELKSDLVDMAAKLGISNHVTWMGNIDTPQELMKQGDIFVLSSRYEGFGLVLLEAMQAGSAIVAASNTAIPEVLGDNYKGLFETGNPQELSNKLIKFANIEFSERSRKYLSERLLLFSLHEMEKSTSSVYLELKKV